ncbi:Hypothetical protein HDN1F_35480 [gamma proteobacterium HdN1]|nr:Hypothetical protein HDN1F_17710 [gamma proteobacterium HdN1]CBL47131.1 Hypothetical protein HDN1F_35480 [gamma proteobacterium HdN1]
MSKFEAKAYNLHTTGVGFINRLRFVKPSGKGKGYFAVAIGALYGVENDEGRAESSLYDLRVVGAKAIEAVKTLQAAFDDNQKIFVEFKAGDTRAEAFQYKRGKREGEWGACIKGSLLQVRKAWINGKLVIDHSSSDVSVETLGQPPAPQELAQQEEYPAASVGTVSEPAHAMPVPSWRVRLAERPERIVLLKNDPELDLKLWEIDCTGTYVRTWCSQEGRLLFVRDAKRA